MNKMGLFVRLSMCVVLLWSVVDARKSLPTVCRLTKEAWMTKPETKYTESVRLDASSAHLLGETAAGPCKVQVEVRVDGQGNIAMAEVKIGQISATNLRYHRRYLFDHFQNTGVFWNGAGLTGITRVPTLPLEDVQEFYTVEIIPINDAAWQFVMTCGEDFVFKLIYARSVREYTSIQVANPADWIAGACWV